jgi:hypothetical protein
MARPKVMAMDLLRGSVSAMDRERPRVMATARPQPSAKRWDWGLV